MTIAETLLAERLDDLRSADGASSPPANVRTTVDHLLDMAFDALWHDDTEHADLITAGAHMEAAIKLLQAYRERLDRLSEVDNDEFMLAAGGTKNERGGWTMPATRDA
ncbi:MAG TPA: hypothetical protein VIL51_07020 [Thermoleophilia bacterium]